jgi:hypothetical protein
MSDHAFGIDRIKIFLRRPLMAGSIETLHPRALLPRGGKHAGENYTRGWVKNMRIIAYDTHTIIVGSPSTYIYGRNDTLVSWGEMSQFAENLSSDLKLTKLEHSDLLQSKIVQLDLTADLKLLADPLSYIDAFTERNQFRWNVANANTKYLQTPTRSVVIAFYNKGQEINNRSSGIPTGEDILRVELRLRDLVRRLKLDHPLELNELSDRRIHYALFVRYRTILTKLLTKQLSRPIKIGSARDLMKAALYLVIRDDRRINELREMLQASLDGGYISSGRAKGLEETLRGTAEGHPHHEEFRDALRDLHSMVFSSCFL